MELTRGQIIGLFGLAMNLDIGAKFTIEPEKMWDGSITVIASSDGLGAAQWKVTEQGAYSRIATDVGVST